MIFLVQRAHPGYIYSLKDGLFIPGPAVGTDEGLGNVPGMGMGMAQVIDWIFLSFGFHQLFIIICLLPHSWQMAWPSEAFVLNDDGLSQSLPQPVLDLFHDKGIE